MLYNLVNYCFSRQDSRDPEHTWPEGKYHNNCFSCLTWGRRGGDMGSWVKWIGNAVFHLLKCQLKSRLSFSFTHSLVLCIYVYARGYLSVHVLGLVSFALPPPAQSLCVLGSYSGIVSWVWGVCVKIWFPFSVRILSFHTTGGFSALTGERLRCKEHVIVRLWNCHYKPPNSLSLILFHVVFGICCYWKPLLIIMG